METYVDPTQIVNLPPWMQTLFTGLAICSFLAPTVIRLFGWEYTELGSRIIHATNDIDRALKRRK